MEVRVNSIISIEQLASEIQPVSEAWRTVARRRLDTLTKPLGSLGQLEDLAAQFVAIRGERWQEPIHKGVYIFAADHGVTAEGVSAYPTEVTRQMVLNFLAGGAAANVLARSNHAALTVIDVGVATGFEDANGLVLRKVAHGTRNMRREAAMSEEQLLQAITVGIDMADAAATAGQNLIAIGEMGIGNTTAASAIACALTSAEAATVTGRGTGVSDAAYAHKVRIVTEAVAYHFATSLPASPLSTLRCVGGLEIAAMTGMMLQAARLGLVIVLDGFISTTAAATAVSLAPACRGYMIAGHSSAEPGHAILLKHLGLQPLLSLNMRLGEGSGALLALPLIEAAIALYAEMATFNSAGVSEASA
jgi:nicotinate-nucleotide--dimethylbenzimidazole phosphoribosyltransferase